MIVSTSSKGISLPNKACQSLAAHRSRVIGLQTVHMGNGYPITLCAAEKKTAEGIQFRPRLVCICVVSRKRDGYFGFFLESKKMENENGLS